MKALLLFVIFSFVAFTQTVYVTKSGTKYHTQDCRYAKSGTAVDLKEVLSTHSPCSICGVNKLTDDAVKSGFKDSTSTKKEVKKTKKEENVSGGRCQATTKKGKQCKRNAKPGSNYCWQHGG